MKFGSYSIILEPSEYGKFGFSFEDNRLMKISNIDNYESSNNGNTDLANDSKSVIKILMDKKESEQYVCKIFEDIHSICKNSELYQFLKDCLFEGEKHSIIINNKNLCYCFIENGGDKDLFDILDSIFIKEKHIFMDNIKVKFMYFIEQMLNAIYYLHENSIAHFDIKPENIVYNNNLNIEFGKRFKLIDFDFSEKYPFINYRAKLKGSTHYTPFKKSSKQYLETMPKWAKNENYNDWLFIDKKFVHYVEYNNLKTYELIYKIDVYALGIVFNQLIYYLTNYDESTHFKCDTHIMTLIQNMTHYELTKRYDIDECITYFENYKNNKVIHSRKECKIDISDIDYNFCDDSSYCIINDNKNKNNISNSNNSTINNVSNHISVYFNLIYDYFNSVIA